MSQIFNNFNNNLNSLQAFKTSKSWLFLNYPKPGSGGVVNFINLITYSVIKVLITKS